jgi:hypothetical protein
MIYKKTIQLLTDVLQRKEAKCGGRARKLCNVAGSFKLGMRWAELDKEDKDARCMRSLL